MQFALFALFAAGIVAADQFTKYLTVANIALGERVPFLPGLLRFTYVRNYGAAFSSFQNQQWLFALIFAVFTLLILWEYRKKSMPFSKFERWCIAAIYGGGLGNMIDRVRLGYVVDMIETEFMEFPVFNVADCFITCGCIALMVSLILFNKEFWKEEKKK
jgi:signal peptidase II